MGNLAFYQLVYGGDHLRGKRSYAATGIGIETSARRNCLALRVYLLSNDGYAAERDKMGRVVLEQHGSGFVQHRETCKAWLMVGVPHSGRYCPPLPPPPSPATVVAWEPFACPDTEILWESVP